MSELADKYIAYLTSVRRYSQRTCTIYKDVLERFEKFTMDTDESNINSTTIRNYEVNLLDEEKLDARTVNLHLSVLSGFCRFLIKEGVLDSNPVRLTPRPKTGKRLPSVFREDAMESYFEATQAWASEENLELLQSLGDGEAGRKTANELYTRRLSRLIVLMLYSTGMRRSELIGLNVGSVDFGRKVVKVRGKGDKMREIPLIDGLCKEISLYLHAVDSMAGSARTGESPLLQTLKGERLYPVFVDRVIKEELGQVEGISGKKSPHVLRHTLATELLDDGTDLNSIKELLGHSSLAATQVYTHNSIEKLKNVYNHAHPRAKNGGNYGDKD
jgi:integrase/recombinase XerC